MRYVYLHSLYTASKESHYSSPVIKLLSPALNITRRIANFRGSETRKAYNGSDNNKNGAMKENEVRGARARVKDGRGDNVDERVIMIERNNTE